MDLIEIIILSFSIWAIVSFFLSQSFEIFLTLLLIGTLIIYEISRNYIPRNVKNFLNSIIYSMLLVFAIIVLRKVLEVLR